VGEIEAVLREHPEVRNVVVLAREEEPGGKRLVAYLVAAQARRPATPELRSFLAEKLPDYMVPSAFVVMKTFPLLPNGKVDRRALPPAGNERPEPPGSYLPPRTPVEETLAGIWGELLGLDRVGAEDNFFELGGHSLVAIQVISRVRDAFGLEVPVRCLFEAPTVAGLALAIVQKGMEEAEPREAARMLSEIENAPEGT
jgi:acyl carrier protein